MNVNKVKHAYSKFEGLKNKEDIDVLCSKLWNFLVPLGIMLRGMYKEIKWDKEKGVWYSEN